MKVTTAAQYSSIKTALESVGFNNLPEVLAIDFLEPNPCSIDAGVNFKTATVTNRVVGLTSAND